MIFSRTYMDRKNEKHVKDCLCVFYSYMDNFKVALWSFNFSFIFIVRIFRVDISREYLRQNKKRKPRTRFPFSWCGRKERSDGIARNERPGIEDIRR